MPKDPSALEVGDTVSYRDRQWVIQYIGKKGKPGEKYDLKGESGEIEYGVPKADLVVPKTTDQLDGGGLSCVRKSMNSSHRCFR